MSVVAICQSLADATFKLVTFRLFLRFVQRLAVERIGPAIEVANIIKDSPPETLGRWPMFVQHRYADSEIGGRVLPTQEPGPVRQRGARRVRDCVHSRSEEHTSELQSLMRISYAVFCLKKKKNTSTFSRLLHA